MRQIRKTIALATVAVMLAGVSGGFAVAQNHNDHHDSHHDNHTYVRHQEWKKGYHMQKNDWNRGERVDYRHYHLQRPPSGYEWRMVDGNYVLGAIATGVIASVIVASTIH